MGPSKKGSLYSPRNMFPTNLISGHPQMVSRSECEKKPSDNLSFIPTPQPPRYYDPAAWRRDQTPCIGTCWWFHTFFGLSSILPGCSPRCQSHSQYSGQGLDERTGPPNIRGFACCNTKIVAKLPSFLRGSEELTLLLRNCKTKLKRYLHQVAKTLWYEFGAIFSGAVAYQTNKDDLIDCDPYGLFRISNPRNLLTFFFSVDYNNLIQGPGAQRLQDFDENVVTEFLSAFTHLAAARFKQKTKHIPSMRPVNRKMLPLLSFSGDFPIIPQERDMPPDPLDHRLHLRSFVTWHYRKFLPSFTILF